MPGEIILDLISLRGCPIIVKNIYNIIYITLLWYYYLKDIYYDADDGDEDGDGEDWRHSISKLTLSTDTSTNLWDFATQIFLEKIYCRAECLSWKIKERRDSHLFEFGWLARQDSNNFNLLYTHHIIYTVELEACGG